MTRYIGRRLLLMLFTLFVISVVSFVLIKAPPGDYLSAYLAALGASGAEFSKDDIDSLREQYGLDQPTYVQYAKWMKGIFRGDFGWSFYWRRPVSDILKAQLPVTILLSLVTTAFIYVIAIPIGIYSAVRQYSALDYLTTFFGFIGLSIPNFLLALILMYLFNKGFGVSIGGLFSRAFESAPWSLAKLVDLLKHLWAPVIVVGTSGTAGLIRVMRAMMLDELQKQYVLTARVKGLPERRVLLKYPVRVAVNPILSTIGWQLPLVISGFVIVSVVMNLPTVGSSLLAALLSEDMYMAGSVVLLVSALTVVGTLLSDILLCIADPRIRYT